MIRYLKITLESDLCAGSGYSYAGVVDRDTCYDRYGLPFIPARGLKGCLREAALLAGEKADLFGVWGQDEISRTTDVKIGNAYLAGREKLTEAFRADPDFFTKERVLEQFTRVKAQTKINESGAADSTSLRFTRIVNQFSPIDGGKLAFYAEIELGSGKDETLRTLTRAAKALRHIGYNRNRGLGNVSCCLTEKLPEETGDRPCRIQIAKDVCDKEEAVLRYQIRSAAPLVISQENAGGTEPYINGQSVLGWFASRYLQEHEADAEFDRLFLKNQICFGPLYPSDEQGHSYRPAPSYLRRLKKSGELVNCSVKEPEKDDTDYGEKVENGRYFAGNGNRTKKLTGTFFRIDEEGRADIREAETELIYHHRHGAQPCGGRQAAGQQEQLYTLTAIREGQYFSGQITGTGKDLRLLAGILERADLSFGKSRSAQYGSCRLLSGSLEKRKEAFLEAEAGSTLLLTLETDGIFLDPEMAEYTVRTEKVRGQIWNALLAASGAAAHETGNAPYASQEEPPLPDEDRDCTELEVKSLEGHYGVWNLRRSSIPCVCAGSTFAFALDRPLRIDLNRLSAGVRSGEGFGRLWIVKQGGRESDRAKRANQWLVKKAEPAEKTKPAQTGNAQEPAQTRADRLPEKSPARALRSRICYQLLKEEVGKNALLSVPSVSLSASAVGRLTLMLEECCYENSEGKQRREALRSRIASMKGSDGKKAQNAEKFVKNYYDRALKDLSSGELLAFLSEEEQEELKLASLRQALVALKYKKKEEKG